MVIHTKGTNQIYKEIKELTKESGTDTSIYKPTPENREKLIHSLTPMVLNIARDFCSKQGSRVELNDCISYGFIGAIEATDKYIKNAVNGVNEAKLSTYAYSWIMKRIENYSKNIIPVVSVGIRSFQQYIEDTKVINGNDSINDSNGSAEMFEILSDENLIEEQNIEHIDKNNMFIKLLEGLTHLERCIVLMKFGIGYESKMNFKDISDSIDKSLLVTKELYRIGIEKIKKNTEIHNITYFDNII